MRVSVLNDKMKWALNRVIKATDSKNPLFGLVMLLAEDARLRLYAMNGDVYINQSVGAKIDVDGHVFVNGKMLKDLVDKLPDERVDFVVAPNSVNVEIGCGSALSHINLPGVIDEFTDFRRYLPDDASGYLEAKSFLANLSAVATCASKIDARPILNGVNFRFDGNSLTLTAADGYRMACHHMELTDPLPPQEWTLPLRGVNMLLAAMKDMDEVRVQVVGNHVVFFDNFTEIWLPIIEGKFPDVAPILVTAGGETFTTFSDTDWRAVVKRAAIFSRDSANSTKLKVGQGEDGTPTIFVNGMSAERGDLLDEIYVESEGPEVEMHFNSEYLLDLPYEGQVTLSLGANKPAVFFQANDPHNKYVVMPMAVNR